MSHLNESFLEKSMPPASQDRRDQKTRDYAQVGDSSTVVGWISLHSGTAKYKPKPQVVERLVKKINCQIKLLLPCVCPVTDWVSTGSFMKLSAIVHTGEQKLGIASPAWVGLAQFQSRIICEGDL